MGDLTRAFGICPAQRGGWLSGELIGTRNFFDVRDGTKH
jgi:hypothetical protein